MQVTNPIIPTKQIEVFVDCEAGLDLKAICIFSAIGFFLDDDTYWKHKKMLRPSTVSTIDSNNKLKTSSSYFNWHYSPRSISFHEALDEFTELFEGIVKEQSEGKKVILPLSGGLDSRTQAVALNYLGSNVYSYSYQLENGYPETKIARKIAQRCNFDFKAFTISRSYLWDRLEDLAHLNGCYTDFTSPRQMAVIDHFPNMGHIFNLGHWGDVLFDNYGVDELTHDQQVIFLQKKLLKKGGVKLASDLWQIWGLQGNFESYFQECISNALQTIAIKNTHARLRAFKSKYWAPRWTSVNLSVFESQKPIALPYYDDRMCKFICTIPEEFLKGRQLQIAYIKRRNPELAKLMWQDRRPYNLYNYTSPNYLRTMSYKVTNKIGRSISKFKGKSYIQRNWELQFLGADNRLALSRVLAESKLSEFISESIIDKYLNDFYTNNALDNAHPINMLLVLATFNQVQNHG